MISTELSTQILVHLTKEIAYNINSAIVTSLRALQP